MSGRITLQVFANHCSAVAEAMAYTLMRTAHSAFVKETEDFSCGLLTPEGVTFASPRKLGTTWFIGLDYGSAINMVERYEEGDVWATNDPYSGAVATHTPDMHVWKPIFVEGELLCFVAGHIHNTDMGGAVPASLSRTLSEIQQEGLRVPPTRIATGGELNEELLRLMGINVRAPKQNKGDLRAQLASLAVGERKIREIVARYGAAGFKVSMARLMDYAEEQARRIIRNVPDGVYSHCEYADEDREGGDPCRIALTLRVAGDEVELDFTGSDPQLASSLNVPTGGNARHTLIMFGLTQVLYTLDKTLLLNSGALRPARAVLPAGSVVNPQAPAAVGMRSLLCNVIQLAILGAFARALPDRLSASPAGSQSILNVKTSDSRRGTIMASIGPVGGGAGGNPAADGLDGSGGNNGVLKNTPVEIIEAEVPIRVLRYGLCSDTGGAGFRRGGMALGMEFQVNAPQTVVTARNRDRSLFGSWGLNGGKAGATSRFTLNPNQSGEVDLGNRDVVALEPGDVLSIVGPGGGGWGDPLQRLAVDVLDDVKRRLLSVERAERDYGVVISHGEVVEEATTRLRGGMSPSAALFDFGEGRAAFERDWDVARYTALTKVLAQTAVPWRHWVKRQIFEALSRKGKLGSHESSYDVESVFNRLKERYPHLLASAS